MPAIIRKMVLKNMAVGTVQYIHSKVMADSPLDAAQSKALGQVVADEPDDQRARYDGEDAVGGQKAPVQTGCTDGPGHGGDNRFGLGNGQRPGKQQLDPGLNMKQKKAVTPTPARISGMKE
jgi:hypothetical protein